MRGKIMCVQYAEPKMRPVFPDENENRIKRRKGGGGGDYVYGEDRMAIGVQNR